jgi:hypothetical protein
MQSYVVQGPIDQVLSVFTSRGGADVRIASHVTTIKKNDIRVHKLPVYDSALKKDYYTTLRRGITRLLPIKCEGITGNH